MYNIIEYSDNYSDNSGSFSQFKRDEVPPDNANNNFTADNSWLLKCKAAFVEKKHQMPLIIQTVLQKTQWFLFY